MGLQAQINSTTYNRLFILEFRPKVKLTGHPQLFINIKDREWMWSVKTSSHIYKYWIKCLNNYLK